MKMQFFAALATAFLTVTAVAQGDAAKAEMSRLKGTWYVHSARAGGEALRELVGGTLVFDGAKLTLISKTPDGKEERQEGTYQLDPSKNPKELDFKGKEAPPKWIYELSKDELKICVLVSKEVKRPKEFTSNGDHLLLILKREKPASASASAVPAADEKKVANLVAQMKGKVARDLYNAIMSIDLHSPEVNDATIKQLAGLRELRQLNLSGSSTTDASVKVLPTLRRLEYLDIANTKVTANGVKQLAPISTLTLLKVPACINDSNLEVFSGFHNLEALDLSACDVNGTGFKKLAGMDGLGSLFLGPAFSDNGIKHLQSIPQLRILHFSGSKLSDNGLKQLAELKMKIYLLELKSTNVTDAGLVHVAKLPVLQTLRLPQAQVTDEGLKHLAKAPKLQELDLSGTRVTDAGLMDLSRIKTLRRVNLKDVKVTSKGIRAMIMANPMISVTQ